MSNTEREELEGATEEELEEIDERIKAVLEDYPNLTFEQTLNLYLELRDEVLMDLTRAIDTEDETEERELYPDSD